MTCQLGSYIDFTLDKKILDLWVFDTGCDIIGEASGVNMGQNWDLDSELPWVVVGQIDNTGESNDLPRSPGFRYAWEDVSAGSGECQVEEGGGVYCMTGFGC